MLKMTIDGEEVVSKNNFTIKEEMLSPSSTILNNTYPKTWEDDKDYTSRFYYPKDYAKLNIQNFSITPEEAGTTIQINGSATLTDVDTTKESRVISLKGQTSQTGTPTPSSPIPVNVVSGDNTIEVCGKNLFDLQDAIITLNGVTATISNGEINLNGTATANTFFTCNVGTPITWTDGQAYTIYGFNPVASSGVRMRTVSTGVNDVTLNATNKVQTINYTTNSNVYSDRLTLRVESGTALSNFKMKPMLIKSSSTTEAYEPYKGNTYPIYLGVENLFNIPNQTNTNQGLTSVISDNVITTTGTTTNTYHNTTSYITNTFGTGTYTFSVENNVSFSVRLRFYNEDDTTAYTFDIPANSKSILVELPTKPPKFRISYTGLTNGTAYNITIRLQLEKGSKVNSFTPYGANYIELCKIGTYQDYIYKDNGSWYLHKEIGKVVLDGSETGWSYASTSDGSLFRKTGISSIENTIPISNYFIGIANSYGRSNGKFYYNVNIPSFDFIDNDFSSLAGFTTWLGTHNTIVYYVLATPTTTEITDTTLLEQLDNLQSD